MMIYDLTSVVAYYTALATTRDVPQAAKLRGLPARIQLAGTSGISYIASVILRDRDNTSCGSTCDPRTAASDGTLEERRYLLQNWRADVTTMVNTLGEPVEWYRYTAYGVPTSHAIADMNGDGGVYSTDAAIWDDLYGGVPNADAIWPDSDLDRDGVSPENDDDTFYYAQYAALNAGSGYSGDESMGLYGLRKGYAGYEYDGTIAMWHARHRVLDSSSGKWTAIDKTAYAVSTAPTPPNHVDSIMTPVGGPSPRLFPGTLSRP